MEYWYYLCLTAVENPASCLLAASLLTTLALWDAVEGGGRESSHHQLRSVSRLETR